jgi:tRNA modification GTPase
MSTIAAISTPRGEGGIAVIRLSGESVFSIAEKVFRGAKTPSKMPGYSCAFGHITDGETEIDECVLTVFRAPHSYTGEDVIEFAVHGGDFTAKKTLALLIKNGAKAARAGEFTERAVLSGKMNLTQAEAVIDIIKARADNELRLANAMKNGVIYRKIEAVKSDLISLSAEIGVSDDYPDDYGEVSADEVVARIEKNLAEIEDLTDGYARGSIIRSGIATVITGKPNVGKSSIMNLLLGTDRSIVTDIPGTTRDTIDGFVEIDGYTLKLTDTAGLRNADDTVEAIGIKRAVSAANSAAITLAVFDLSREFDENDELTKAGFLKDSTVIIFNKTDKPQVFSESFKKDLEANYACVHFCAKSGEGLRELRFEIGKIIEKNIVLPDTEAILSERQFAAAENTKNALIAAKEAALAGSASDIYSVLLSEAINSLFELTGESLTETVSKDIFSRFCVGK